jgi:uncharacterized GH25 family protein
MYAKAIVLAGAPDEGYKRAIGLPIEFIPEKDPYQLKPGESLPVRVLVRGAPAKDLEVKQRSPGRQETRIKRLAERTQTEESRCR